MHTRTSEIIMVCKGQHDFGDFPTLKQAVIAYMSDRCLCPEEAYTDSKINEIIWTAALDYIDSFKEYFPSSFLRECQRVMDLHNNPLVQNINRVDMYEAICGAFSLAQVRNDAGYINGFTEENTQFVRRENAEWFARHAAQKEA